MAKYISAVIWMLVLVWVAESVPAPGMYPTQGTTLRRGDDIHSEGLSMPRGIKFPFYKTKHSFVEVKQKVSCLLPILLHYLLTGKFKWYHLFLWELSSSLGTKSIPTL